MDGTIPVTIVRKFGVDATVDETRPGSKAYKTNLPRPLGGESRCDHRIKSFVGRICRLPDEIFGNGSLMTWNILPLSESDIH